MQSDQFYKSKTLAQSSCLDKPRYSKNVQSSTKQNSNKSNPSSPLFQIQNLRIHTQKVSNYAHYLFSLNHQDMKKQLLKYTSLPKSPINIKALLTKKVCKVVKSDRQKIYIGEIQNQKRNGQGIIIYQNGRVFQGHFKNNQRQGFGVEVFPNGNFYIGHYKQNKMHGKGIFYWFNLSQNSQKEKKQNLVEYYVGQWWGGLPDGQGQHFYQNGGVYKGDFKNGLKHGKGFQKCQNGTYYGDFVNGLRQGSGTFTWIDGSVYDGDFKQGFRHGYGKWTKQSRFSQNYEGWWNNDRRHGMGVYSWCNGYIYKGNYFQDQRNGKGQLYYHNNLIYKGQWVNGKQVSSSSNSKRELKRNSMFSIPITQRNTKQLNSTLTKTSRNFNSSQNLPKTSQIIRQIPVYFEETTIQSKSKSKNKMKKNKHDQFCLTIKPLSKNTQRHNRKCQYCIKLDQMKKAQMKRIKSMKKTNSLSKIPLNVDNQSRTNSSNKKN